MKNNRYSKLPVPKFKRVRMVQLEGEHLTCSCCFYQRHGMPCRHIMAVNGLPMLCRLLARFRMIAAISTERSSCFLDLWRFDRMEIGLHLQLSL